MNYLELFFTKLMTVEPATWFFINLSVIYFFGGYFGTWVIVQVMGAIARYLWVLWNLGVGIITGNNILIDIPAGCRKASHLVKNKMIVVI